MLWIDFHIDGLLAAYKPPQGDRAAHNRLYVSNVQHLTTYTYEESKIKYVDT